MEELLRTQKAMFLKLLSVRELKNSCGPKQKKVNKQGVSCNKHGDQVFYFFYL